MVSTCSVVGCKSRYHKESKKAFFRFPLRPEDRREKWIKAVNRVGKNGEAWDPARFHRVCSDHFYTGKSVDHPKHPDYVPTRNLDLLKISKKTVIDEMKQKVEEKAAAAATLLELSMHAKKLSKTKVKTTNKDTQTFNNVSMEISVLQAKVRTLETELSMLHNNQRLSRKKIETLLEEQEHFHKTKFTFSNVKKNITFLTGVNLEVFQVLKSKIDLPESISLSVDDSLLLTLMKLRLGCPNPDLCIRFAIPISTVNKILHLTLDQLCSSLKDLIVWPITWPEYYICQENLPSDFQGKYNKVISLIDCFEINIKKPTNATARAQTWSKRKHAYTIKFFISITPSGSVSFISEGWGGLVSDKQLVHKSGYFDKLRRGNHIITDKRLAIREECATRGVIAHVPVSTKQMNHISKGVDIDASKDILSLRRHINRVISRLRTFRILTNSCPLSLVALLDKIVVILAGIVNLQNFKSENHT